MCRGRPPPAPLLFDEKEAAGMIEMVLIAAGVALLSMTFFAFAPRCPECGSYLSYRSKQSPSIRHCRGCLNVYEVER